MDFSSPRLRKILVGVAIFMIVVFIVIRFFRRSNYAYPKSSEEGTFSITAVPTFAAASGGTPALVTFTTTAAHGFSSGELIYITGVTGVVYTEPITGYPTGAGSPSGGTAVYIYSIGAGATPSTFTVKATNAGSKVSSVTIAAGGLGGGYNAPPLITFSDPPTGASNKATGTATISGGKITGVTVTSGGSGYTSAPSISVGAGTTLLAGPIVNMQAISAAVASATVQSIVKPSMDKLQNTDLLACQTQYATDLITSPSTMTTSASQSIISTGNKVVNVNSTNGFADGDKVLIPGVLDSSGKAAVLVIETGGVTTTSLTFTAASVPTTSQTILPQTAVSDITAAYAKRTTCIQSSATSYTVGHCRYLPQAGTNRPIVPLVSDDPVAAAAYQTYQTDIQTITTAYAPSLSRVTQTSSFPTGGTVAGGTLTQTQQQAIVEAARKADLANATQKYLASVCPGFYAQTSGSTTTDPSNDYKAWATTPTDPTSGGTVTVPTTAKRFWAGGVTDASIMTWAQNAGIVTLSGPVMSVTIPGSGIGSGYSAAPLVTFSAAPSGGTTATGTATISGGKITGVTVTVGGSGYTTNPTITFSAVTGATAPTDSDLGSIVVQISTSLSATGPLVPSGINSFTPTSGGAITYTNTKYSQGGTGDNANWRLAYKNGPGTYPKPAYTA
jgi:hypothetical protein